MSVTLIGVDPGLVDSGIVAVTIDLNTYEHQVDYATVADNDINAIVSAVRKYMQRPNSHVFIEKYIDRGTIFQSHSRMREMEHALKLALPNAKLVNNTGSKKITTIKLMQLLGLHKFPTTNHQDLQAAARIAIYGALKETDLNGILYMLATTLLKKGVIK